MVVATGGNGGSGPGGKGGTALGMGGMFTGTGAAGQGGIGNGGGGMSAMGGKGGTGANTGAGGNAGEAGFSCNTGGGGRSGDVCLPGKTFCHVKNLSASPSTAACESFTDSARGADCSENPTCGCLCDNALFFHCLTECRCSEANGRVTVTCNPA
jgi:hypothetical protein